MQGHQYVSSADSGKGFPPPPSSPSSSSTNGHILAVSSGDRDQTIGKLSCLFHQCAKAIHEDSTLLTQLPCKGPIPNAITGDLDLSI